MNVLYYYQTYILFLYLMSFSSSDTLKVTLCWRIINTFSKVVWCYMALFITSIIYSRVISLLTGVREIATTKCITIFVVELHIWRLKVSFISFILSQQQLRVLLFLLWTPSMTCQSIFYIFHTFTIHLQSMLNFYVKFNYLKNDWSLHWWICYSYVNFLVI